MSTIARLTDEDLVRWRLHSAKWDSMQLYPNDYSRAEREELHMQHFMLVDELSQRYAPDITQFYIAADTGEVIEVGE